MGNVVVPLWAECPAVTRLCLASYLALTLGLSLLGAASGLHAHRFFACSAWAVLREFRLWTVAASAFYRPLGGMSVLIVPIELYMGMVHFPHREKELGSTAFAAWVIIANSTANLLYLVGMLALSTLDARYFFKANLGMFELIMVSMSLLVLGDPGGSTNLWGLVVLPNKWYPLALVGIFSLLNLAVMWNFLAAVAVGYIALRFPSLHTDRLLPPQALLKRVEDMCCCQRTFLGGWWVPLGGSCLPGPRGVGGGSTSYSPVPSLFGAARELQSTSKFTAFSGAGRRLGDGSEGGASQAVRPVGPAVAAQAGQPAQLEPPKDGASMCEGAMSDSEDDA